MNGKQFIDRAIDWAKARDVEWRVELSRGKGGHKLLYVGERRTAVQTGEIPAREPSAMLRQLAIPKTEF